MTLAISKTRITSKKQFNIEGIKKSVTAVTQSAGDKIKSDLDAITSSWNHDVKFTVRTRVQFEGASTRVTTDDDVFHYLNKGTSVRYALMSPDWKSKTSPGKMRSGSGRGRVLYIGKRKPWRRSRKRWPRPGIKARGWMRDVQKSNTRAFQRDVVNSYRGKLIV